MQGDAHIQHLQPPDIRDAGPIIGRRIIGGSGRQGQSLVNMALIAGAQVELTRQGGEFYRDDFSA
ncbi:hypothetical protein D3C80_2148260 [compost metagenome]